MYYTANTFTFFVEAIKSNDVLVGKDLVEVYVTYGIKVFPFLVLALFLIILWVLLFKRKECKDYTVAIIIVIFVIVISRISFSTLSTLEIEVLDSKTLRLIRDFLAISMLLQIFPIILTLIRSTGFDIKKFDFGRDIDQLKISDLDREEFEVSVNFDTNLMRRKNNYRIRHLKYFYKENTLAINITLLILVSSITIYTTLLSKSNRYDLGGVTEFTANGASVKIGNVYAVNKDYKGNVISEYDSLLMVEAYFQALDGKVKNINTSKYELIINNHTFTPIIKYKTKVMDVGDLYINNELTEDYKRYLLVYEIPTTYIEKEKDFHVIYYIDDTNTGKTKYYNISLGKINLLDQNLKETKYKVGDQINFTGSLYGSSIFKIEKVDFGRKFEVGYNFCYATNQCISSIEYVSTTYSGAYDKSLIRIKYNYNYDNDSVMSKFSSINQIIKYFSTLSYTIDGKIKTFYPISLISPTKTSKSDYLYLDVPQEVNNASEIYLTFNIRNYSYIYQIK